MPISDGDTEIACRHGIYALWMSSSEVVPSEYSGWWSDTAVSNVYSRRVPESTTNLHSR